MAKGRWWRWDSIFLKSSRVTTGCPAAVVLTIRSASTINSRSRSQWSGRHCHFSANILLRSKLRFTMVTSWAPSDRKYWSVSSAISPAPINKIFLSSKRWKIWVAKSLTATAGILIRLWWIAVSAATRRAAFRAAWNTPCVSGPVLPSRVASS